jgi:hypothetical protein
VRRTHFSLRTFSEKTLENYPSQYNYTLQYFPADGRIAAATLLHIIPNYQAEHVLKELDYGRIML